MKLESIGMEEHLYRDMECCLHPCSVRNCPEPICAVEFPGGINAYLKFRRFQKIMEETNNLQLAADTLNITVHRAKYLAKKVVFICEHATAKT